MMITVCGVTAQYDTIRPHTYFNNRPLKNVQNQESINIENKAFPYFYSKDIIGTFIENNLLNGLLIVKKISPGKGHHSNLLRFDNDIAFNNCILYNGDSTIELKSLTNYRYQINGNLNIHDFIWPNNSLFLRGLSITRSAYVGRSQLNNIDIEDCRGNFGLQDNTINGSVYFLKLKKGSFDIITDTFKQARAEIHVVRSVLEDISFIRYNSYADMHADFSYDTLRGVLHIVNGKKSHDVDKKTTPLQHYFGLTFTNCDIDAEINYMDNADTASIIFKNCRFGPNASLDIRADTVSFVDCQGLPATLNLQLKANNERCWIRLNNTNITNVDFVYSSDHHLLFDSAASLDTYASTYENLLAKFRSENKKESYQRLDIEYNNYKASRGNTWDRLFNWLDSEWWNYGYSKTRVIGWTFAFLGIFFGLNIYMWRHMQKMYPISQEQDYINRYSKPFLYHTQRYTRILLYTAYIFFSIRIDLKKLRITTLPMLIYFFLQFLIGLWCLFFIVNALLKIG